MTTAPIGRDFRELFNAGAHQLQAMQWAEAEQTFEACTKLRPDFAPSWANLAMAYFRQDKTDPALDAARKAVDIDATASGSWIALAFAQLHAGLFRESAAAAERAAKLAGQAAGSVPQGTAALAYEALGDYEATLKAARKARKAAPIYDRLSHVMVADALRMLERDRAALREYDEILANEGQPSVTIIGEPPMARAFRGKGLLHYKLGVTKRRQQDLLTAANCFEDAINRDPMDPRNHAGLGMAKRQLYLFPDALVAVDKAISLSRKDGFLALERGLILFELACYQEAVAELETALEDPSLEAGLRAKAYEFRAVSYGAGDQDDSCLGACAEAMEDGVQSVIILNAKAMAHYRKDETDEALAIIREARELSPDDPVVIGNEGLLLFDKGEDERAEELFQLALTKGPRSPEVLIGRFSFLLREGRHQDAERFIREVEERLSDLPNVLQYVRSRAQEAGLIGSLHAAGDRIAQLEEELALRPSRTQPPSAVFDKRIAELEALLDKEGVIEEEIKQFLKDERSRFMFGAQAARTHTEHQLGSDFKCDFVLEYPERRYKLIEIERPIHVLFTNKGDKRQPLVHACQQIEDWQQWLDENNSYAQTKLPGCVSPEGLVVIGRARDLTEADERRLQRANITSRGLLKIMTYDGLLREARAIADSIRRMETAAAADS